MREVALMTGKLPEGFVAHDGGPCPIDRHSWFTPLFRGDYDNTVGRVLLCIRIPRVGRRDIAKYADWMHHPLNPSRDIIAYKPEPTP